MKYTEEQNDIINSDEESIIIVAYAGTGKTSTLIEFTKSGPLNSFLYLAYNSSIKKEGRKKFFGNTSVHTIHSLAYANIGLFYEHKLKKNIKLIDIIMGVDSLKEEYLRDQSNQEIYILADRVLSIMNTYFTSATFNLSDFRFEEVDLAEEYWAKMQDINNDKVKMSHDGYLKLFQISEPKLGYEYILIDEAQDSNEVMLDIILKQDCKKIFVGDEHQEIYGFRNVQNIFKNSQFNNFKRYYLSKSFRFGESVAFVANHFLERYKKEEMMVQGLGNDEIVVSLDDELCYATITRTNAHLFDLAVDFAKDNKRIFIIGGENFVFDEIKDCYNLYKGNLYKINDFYIKQFNTFGKMKDIAEKTKDMELLFLIKIIEKYEDSIFGYIEKIQRLLVSKESAAERVLTTTHKSKGLEFFNVCVAEDFYPLFSKDGNLYSPERVPYEEVNLYYVAITRAIEKIKLNDDIIKVISIK